MNKYTYKFQTCYVLRRKIEQDKELESDKCAGFDGQGSSLLLHFSTDINTTKD